MAKSRQPAVQYLDAVTPLARVLYAQFPEWAQKRDQAGDRVLFGLAIQEADALLEAEQEDSRAQRQAAKFSKKVAAIWRSGRTRHPPAKE